MRVIEFATLPETKVTREDVIGHQLNRALVSRDATGTESLVVDVVRFPPGFNHQLHRHPDGDQVAVVLDGQIIAYDRNDERVVSAGSAVLFCAGDWHGVRVEGAEALVLNLFPGVGSVPEAGYQASDPSFPGPTRGVAAAMHGGE
ncbi:MAG: cupin domain-containing protein [Solirubrobacteraceae bacterium]